MIEHIYTTDKAARQ